jgi:hypothetical protein
MFNNKVIVKILDLRLDFWNVMGTNLTDGYKRFRGTLPRDRALNPKGVGTSSSKTLVTICQTTQHHISLGLQEAESSSIYPCILNISLAALPVLLQAVTQHLHTHLTKIHKQFLYFILNVLS